MAQSVIQSDLLILGQFSCNTLNAPAGCISDAQIAVGTPIQATKTVHQFSHCAAQPDGVNVAAVTQLLHVARAGSTGGAVLEFDVAVTTPPTGAMQFTVDLQRSTAGGAFASILTGVVTITAANTARQTVQAALATTAYLAGDQFQIVVTPSGGSGTQAQGMAASLWLRENP